MRPKRYILGSGIAGLVYGYYHPDYTIIGSEPGGAMSNPIPLGPRYLHVTPATTRFLAELGLTPGSVAEVKAGYLDDHIHQVLPIHEMSELDRSQYLLKTRGLGQIDDSALETSHHVYLTPRLDEITAVLVEIAKQRKRLLSGKVESIHLGGRVVEFMKQWLPYEQLVNTLPIPEFNKLRPLHQRRESTLPVGGSYLSIPVQFVFSKLALDEWQGEPYDYYYVPSLHVQYSRVAKVTALDGTVYACFEYPGEEIVDAPDAVLLLPNYTAYPVETAMTVKYGRLISRPVYVPEQYQADVRHFGRFAEWQDSYLTHHLIAKAQG